MGKKPVRLFGPDCHAAATRYHAGQSNAQLTTHKASLLHAEIISTVVVSAKTEAARNEIGAPCHPRRTPQIAGGRNNKKLGPAKGKHRKKQQGRTDRTALAQRVRREAVPTM
jgi:hypothetical protein